MIDEMKLLEDIDEYFCDDCSECGGHCRHGDIVTLILKQQKFGEWIPCSERLPESEHEWYLTTHEDGSLIPHRYTKQHGFILNWEIFDLKKRERQGDVVAWLPLPEPYKEGGD